MVQGTDTDNDYDIQMSTNTEGALDDNSTDPTGEPYFARLVTVAGANFYTGSAAGTWTLRVCDRDNNTVNGTFNRARLVLTSADVVPNICTSTIEYQWEDNGNNVPFTNATVGGVTITLTSTRDLTSDGANTAGRNNFTTQQGTFGNEFGYYIMQYDDGANGGPQNPEAVLLESSWSFSPPVRYQTWRHLDVDNGSWEDFIRVTAIDSGGGRVPYSLALGPVHQMAGDIIETDGANVPDTSTDGNVQYNFASPVASLVVEYMRGDDFTDPASQRIGMGSPGFCAFDYGDAADSYGTLLGSNGARHVLGLRAVYLGANPPDGEDDGQPVLATQDDTTQVGGVDDEDGTSVAAFPACPNDTSYTMSVDASNVTSPSADAYLVGYMDWNRDGDFGDAGEQSATVIVPQANVDPASYVLNWSSVPADCGGTSATYSRFRISTTQASVESPVGQAADGEVEDYRLADGTLPVTIAWVESSVDGDELAIRWATASESGNAGFRIWGRDAKGSPRLLTSVRSHDSDSFVPLGYEARVDGRGIRSFEIEDVSVLGRNRLHGPFAAGAGFGVDPTGAEIDWAAIRAESRVVTEMDRVAAARGGTARIAELASSPAPPGRPAGGALLYVRDKGIQRVTYEQLVAAGVNLLGIPVGRLALLDNSVAIPRFVHGPGTTFGPGGYIEFFADPRLTLASPVDAYVLRVDPRLAVAPQALAPSGGAPGVARAEDVHENEVGYSYSSSNGDPWYDAAVLAWGGPGAITRSFDLPDLAAGPVELQFRGWGWVAWPGSAPPDHHVVVKLNGIEVANERFDGPAPLDLMLEVSGEVEAEGNELEVLLPGDTGYEFDYFAYDGFTVRYPRATVARDGRFAGQVESAGPVAIGGFAEGESVAIWRRAGAKLQRGEQAAAGGAVSALGGAELYAASAAAVDTPGIERNVPSTQFSSNAEYVIVTHPAFAGSLGTLVALQQAKGLSTEIVTVDRIYAAYSDHVPSAGAVKRFFAASIARNLRYALIVGADSSDPYDHLGLGSVSYVPTDYQPLSEYVQFSPTDETLVDADDDGLGDVPIGRLPARTPAELSAMVAKLVAWEGAVASGRTALLSAGISDGESATLTSLNGAYAASLDAWSVTLAPVDQLGTDAARASLLAAINGGVKLVSYVGHSSMGQWDWTPLLRWQDAATLTNAGAPNLVTAWGCWNSYYVEPTIESLAARLLRQPDAGAAGAIGATTLTSESSHQALGSLFFAQVNAGAPTVGDAFHAAKQALATQTVAPDAILGMTLLGDPAMSLPPVE